MSPSHSVYTYDIFLEMVLWAILVLTFLWFPCHSLSPLLSFVHAYCPCSLWPDSTLVLACYDALQLYMSVFVITNKPTYTHAQKLSGRSISTIIFPNRVIGSSKNSHISRIHVNYILRCGACHRPSVAFSLTLQSLPGL